VYIFGGKMIDYRQHLHCYSDLITSYAETRAGFISIALEKNRHASPYVEEARILKSKVSKVADANELIDLTDIRFGLIAAAGVSDKAIKYLGKEGCDLAISEFIRNFLLPAGEKFKEELVFRYLLTKGDALGGSMRNIIGSLAQKKLCTSLGSALRLAGRDFQWLNPITKQWVLSDNTNIEIANARGLSWKTLSNQSRLLLFNVKVPIVRNNIDIVLIDSTISKKLRQLLNQKDKYIALGELKGGIDPAGADEHWKTAKSALDRIKNTFLSEGLHPALLYLGAAIQNKMAEELFNLLSAGYIQNAGNFTKHEHIISVVEWILSL
jgi:type II restriction enzyme